MDCSCLSLSRGISSVSSERERKKKVKSKKASEKRGYFALRKDRAHLAMTFQLLNPAFAYLKKFKNEKSAKTNGLNIHNPLAQNEIPDRSSWYMDVARRC